MGQLMTELIKTQQKIQTEIGTARHRLLVLKSAFEDGSFSSTDLEDQLTIGAAKNLIEEAIDALDLVCG